MSRSQEVHAPLSHSGDTRPEVAKRWCVRTSVSIAGDAWPCVLSRPSFPSPIRWLRFQAENTKLRSRLPSCIRNSNQAFIPTSSIWPSRNSASMKSWIPASPVWLSPGPMSSTWSEVRDRRPLIASDCPATIRLIQVKYPDLVELISPLDVPREVTARDIRARLPAKLGLKPEDIGIIYVSPCPAKIVSIRQPAEKVKSWFDGAICIRDVYSLLIPHVVAIKSKFDKSRVPKNFRFSVGWAVLGRADPVDQEGELAVRIRPGSRDENPR